MKRSSLRVVLFSVVLLATQASSAWAYAEHRFGAGLGVIRHGDPAETDVEMSAEYEYRFLPVLGVGGLFQYTFSTPGETLLGLPVFWHPLAGDWYLLAAPLLDFKGGNTYVGTRVGTRIPIGAGPVTVLPSFFVDFINGHQDYIFGLGIGFGV